MDLRALVAFQWALWVVGTDTCGLVPDLWAHVFRAHSSDALKCLLYALEGITQMMGFLLDPVGFCGHGGDEMLPPSISQVSWTGPVMTEGFGV